MIKLVFCLKRLPQLNREQFQTYWRETHAPLVNRHAQSLNIIRYVQNHSAPENSAFALAKVRGSGGEDFDGVAELWWRDMESYASGGQTPEGRAAGMLLLEDEARFIDLPRSPIFLADENEVLG